MWVRRERGPQKGYPEASCAPEPVGLTEGNRAAKVKVDLDGVDQGGVPERKVCWLWED